MTDSTEPGFDLGLETKIFDPDLVTQGLSVAKSGLGLTSWPC